MPTAAAALRAAIHDALIADVPLTTLLGGPRVYDEPPQNPPFPYVTLGEARISGLLDRFGAWRGAPAHAARLVAPGRPQGGASGSPVRCCRRSTMRRCRSTIIAWVNFRFALADVRREADGRTYHAVVRFRAVTEPQ